MQGGCWEGGCAARVEVGFYVEVALKGGGGFCGRGEGELVGEKMG